MFYIGHLLRLALPILYLSHSVIRLLNTDIEDQIGGRIPNMSNANEKGSASDFIFFWDHIVSPSNPYTLAVFSQWYPLQFIDSQKSSSASDLDLELSDHTNPSTSTSTNTSPASSEVVFKTAEHYMMYSKALLFDPTRAQDVLDAETPADAQKIGRELRHFDRKRWDEVNDGIVERANYLKFGQNRDDKALRTLLDTGDKELVEASPKDRIWGIGYGKEDAWEHRDDWGTNRYVLPLQT